jgi:lipid-binding SYLF domain-containing protein
MNKLLIAGIAICMALTSPFAFSAWDTDEETEYDQKAQEVLTEFKKNVPDAQKFFDKAVGYVVIPTVGKAAVGIGGARGKGLLYEGDAVTAAVTLTQVSFGFQGGGQAYSEFIFFEDDITLANFKKGNFELNAQASAVAITAGVSADAAFNDGMAIFTLAKGGLMYEAAVGGQKFKVELK